MTDEKKLTKIDTMPILKTLCYALETKEKRAEKQEQERTTIKKQMFLDTFVQSMGVITICCDKIGVSREIFYRWKREDNNFAEALDNIINQKNDVAEDLLWGLITIKKDPTSIRYYLDRRHPKYKPRSETEVVVGDRTLEDIIDEDEAKLNIKPKKDIKQLENGGTNNEDKQILDRKVIEDKNEEGGKGAVQVQHGAVVVLGKENEEKPNTESEAKGVK